MRISSDTAPILYVHDNQTNSNESWYAMEQVVNVA
jgi:hypothetical protein